MTDEVRTTSATGGEKGVKSARFDLIPIGPLTTVAKLYGRGAEKYADHNWRRGYEWSKSYAALMRHLTQFWAGEDLDEETGLPHMASVVFHAFALLEFSERFPEYDDRFLDEERSEIPTKAWADFDEAFEWPGAEWTELVEPFEHVVKVSTARFNELNKSDLEPYIRAMHENAQAVADLASASDLEGDDRVAIEVKWGDPKSVTLEETLEALHRLLNRR